MSTTNYLFFLYCTMLRKIQKLSIDVVQFPSVKNTFFSFFRSIIFLIIHEFSGEPIVDWFRKVITLVVAIAGLWLDG